MFLEITAALDALRETAKLAGALKNIAETAKLNDLRIAIQDQVLTAQERVLELQALLTTDRETIAQLREEARSVHQAQADREKYKLRSVGPLMQLARFAEANAETGEPEHWLCEPCFQANKKIILQPSPNGNLLTCATEVRHNIRVDRDPPRPAAIVQPLLGSGGGENGWMVR